MRRFVCVCRNDIYVKERLRPYILSQQDIALANPEQYEKGIMIETIFERFITDTL